MAPQWFGKEEGEGLRPLTWHGWAVTALFIVLVAVAAFLGPKGILVFVAATAAYLGVVFLTGGRTNRREP